MAAVFKRSYHPTATEHPAWMDNPPQYYADECSIIINEYEVEFHPFENLLEILLKRNSRESRPLTNLQHKKEDARIKKHIDFLVKSDNW